MQKYVCTICGFIYDEALGYDKDGLVSGTLWSDVPAEWKCPLCGASKDEFKVSDDTAKKVNGRPLSDIPLELPKEINYTPAELSAIFSNIAKGWEKQYQLERATLCQNLSTYYSNHSQTELDGDWSVLSKLLNEDLTSAFTNGNNIASVHADRGALRALKWAEQVSRMANAHVNRMMTQGHSFIENTNVFVCEICGFIYIGDETPEVCPVCKVPNKKMIKIERGA
jgi:rubrerythrin